METVPIDDAIARIAEAGYDGIETGVPAEGAEEFVSKLEAAGLIFVAMLFEQEVESYENALAKAVDCGAKRINVHSGRDHWSFDQGCSFFEGVLKAEQKYQAPVGHETHRYRLFYCPWSTGSYLKQFPELKVSADFSHWTTVCETLLEDQTENLELAISRAVHVHARVGHQEGPQVADPRAPEYQDIVEQFEVWWDAILKAHKDRGESEMFVDPEFGPPRYLQTLPYTGAPVADLWDICAYMKDRLRKRWG